MADGSLSITYIGGPTALIEIGGWRLLTDPTFDPPGRRYSFGLGTSSRKLAGPAVAAAELGRLDAVLLSHDQHEDNLDAAGRELLESVETVLTTSAGARRLGDRARGLSPWQTTELSASGRVPIEVTSTPCRHGPPLSGPLVGEVSGFALRAGDGRGALWMTGDTVLYDGLRDAARRLEVDVMLLHIGGVRFPASGPLRYTMNGREAVELCELADPATIVPVHYEGWSHFRDGRAGFERALASAPAGLAERVVWLQPGIQQPLG